MKAEEEQNPTPSIYLKKQRPKVKFDVPHDDVHTLTDPGDDAGFEGLLAQEAESKTDRKGTGFEPRRKGTAYKDQDLTHTLMTTDASSSQIQESAARSTALGHPPTLRFTLGEMPPDAPDWVKAEKSVLTQRANEADQKTVLKRFVVNDMSSVSEGQNFEGGIIRNMYDSGSGSGYVQVENPSHELCTSASYRLLSRS